MNSETLMQLRTTVAEIDALCATGRSLDGACRQFGITARSYRRWTELLSYSRGDETDVGAVGIASLIPELEAEFGCERFASGDVLFRQGDYADEMFVVAHGAIDIVELGTTVQSGDVVGEIGIFSEAQRRTASAACLVECDLIRIPRKRALELSWRKPTLGLAMAQIMAERLARNAVRLCDSALDSTDRDLAELLPTAA